MGKGSASAPSAPNYGPEMQAEWNDVWPYAQQYLQSQIPLSQAQAGLAESQVNNYNTTYAPMETAFANTANTYANPANVKTLAGQAMGDVTNQFTAARQSALGQLESYGVDPSQARFGALDLGSKVSEAAATAAAGTQSALNTKMTGLNLQNTAINIGRGYPGAIAGLSGGATNSGLGGIEGANSPLTSIANMQNMGFNNALGSAQLNTQIQGNFASGLGSLIGGGVSLAGNLGLL